MSTKGAPTPTPGETIPFPTMPYSYDGVKIVMSPISLQNVVVRMNDTIGDILNQLSSMMHTLENLQLSWTGQSADEAQTFVNRWNAAITGLIGTDKNPDQGVLNLVLQGVGVAIMNMSTTDLAVGQMFDNLQLGSGVTNPFAPRTGAWAPAAAETAIEETA